MWFASVTVGMPDDRAATRTPSPCSISRATFGAAPRGGEVVEHVRVRAVEQEADDVLRASTAGIDARRMRASPSWPASAAPVGARRDTEELGDGGRRRRRAAPPAGTTPSPRTPLPAITNGARAWTTPSDPCSPRWPPWSSQLCAAEWITHRSGAAGWSKSWAVCSKANGYELWPRSGCGSASSAASPARWAGDWSAKGWSPSTFDLLEVPVDGPAEDDPAVGAGRLVTGRRPCAGAPCRRSAPAPGRAGCRAPAREARSRQARVPGAGRAPPIRVPIARCGARGLTLSLLPAVISRAVRVPTFTPKPSDITRAWHVVDAEGARARSRRHPGRHVAPRQAQADLGAPRRLSATTSSW